MKDRREFNVPADHRMEYLDGTQRRTQYYTTRDGFLKAYIRMTENPSRYSILHAD